MATILKNLVTKTATATGVKLAAPADRIGSGLVNVASYPAEVLSPGQFPLPQCPGSESNRGHRQELSARRMRMHPRAMATAVPPAGPAGHPGSSAYRGPWSLKPTKRSFVSRASFPAAVRVRERVGDCQSPDRRDDRRAAMSWEATPIAAAAF